MKTREEVSQFIAQQMHVRYECSREKGEQYHYGLQELRELMDFIYDGTPTTDSEMLKGKKR